MRRHVATIFGLLLVAAAATGCSTLGFLVEKTTRVVQGPPKTTPEYSIEGQHVLVLVDVGSTALETANPRLRYKVAQAIASELTEQKAAASVVSPRAVMMRTQMDPAFAGKSVAAVGREFDVDRVLHFVVEGYELERAVIGDSFNAYASLSLKIIDPETGEKVFPDSGGSKFVEVRSSTGIQKDTHRAAEQVLLDGLALKVGQLFVPYEINEMPLGPEVR